MTHADRMRILGEWLTCGSRRKVLSRVRQPRLAAKALRLARLAISAKRNGGISAREMTHTVCRMIDVMANQRKSK